MGADKASRSSLNRIVWTLLAVFVFYIVGVFVRHAYGVRFEIGKASGSQLGNFSYMGHDGNWAI